MTRPLRSTSGPPLLPGEAAAEKRSHFQRPPISSGVSDVYRPSRMMMPSPSALPTAYTASLSGGRLRGSSGDSFGVSRTVNTA